MDFKEGFSSLIGLVSGGGGQPKEVTALQGYETSLILSWYPPTTLSYSLESIDILLSSGSYAGADILAGLPYNVKRRKAFVRSSRCHNHQRTAQGFRLI